MSANTLRRFLAEVLGTLLLVMVSCMVCVQGWGPTSQLHSSIGSGMIVMIVIQVSKQLWFQEETILDYATYR
jgi:glycerol uptake facilitator-like aquaporin